MKVIIFWENRYEVIDNVTRIEVDYRAAPLFAIHQSGNLARLIARDGIIKMEVIL